MKSLPFYIFTAILASFLGCNKADHTETFESQLRSTGFSFITSIEDGVTYYLIQATRLAMDDNDLALLKTCPGVIRLLNVSHTRVDGTFLKDFPKPIHSLIFQGCDIELSQAAAYAHWNSVEFLDLSTTDIDNGTLAQLSVQWTGLRMLALNDCEMLTDDFLHSIANLTDLYELQVNGIVEESTTIPDKTMVSLRILSLKSCHITNELLSMFPSIVVLNASESTFSQSEAVTLPESIDILIMERIRMQSGIYEKVLCGVQLDHLSLSGSHIGRKLIDQILNCQSSIKDLNLSDIGIDDIGRLKLSNINNLHHLSIMNFAMSEDLVLELENLKGLQSLGLTVTQESCQRFLNYLKSSNVERVQVRTCDDATYKTLQQEDDAGTILNSSGAQIEINFSKCSEIK